MSLDLNRGRLETWIISLGLETLSLVGYSTSLE